jgi:hypothetical protein
MEGGEFGGRMSRAVGSSGYPEEPSSFLAEGTIDLRDLDHML